MTASKTKVCEPCPHNPGYQGGWQFSNMTCPYCQRDASNAEIERLRAQVKGERALYVSAKEANERLTRDLKDLKEGDERIFERLREALSLIGDKCNVVLGPRNG
jgi:hypothetical protein